MSEGVSPGMRMPMVFAAEGMQFRQSQGQEHIVVLEVRHRVRKYAALALMQEAVSAAEMLPEVLQSGR